MLSNATVSSFNTTKLPYCQWGQEVLNLNIPWWRELAEILYFGKYTKTWLARRLGTSSEVIDQILNRNYTHLDFKLGTKILYEHGVVNPIPYMSGFECLESTEVDVMPSPAADTMIEEVHND